MKFKVELLQTSLNKLNILCGHYLDPIAMKISTIKSLTWMYYLWSEPHRGRGLLWWTSADRAKMNKIIFALWFSLWACLFAQNFFRENELSLWKKKSGFKNDWLLCHCLQCSNSILNGICITAHGESYLFSPFPLLLEPNCQKYIFCINMILSPL